MRPSAYRFLLTVLVFGVVPIWYSNAAQPEPRWNEKMRDLGKVYGDLLLDLSSDRRFKAPENHERILRNATKVAAAAKDLHRNREKADSDLTIGFVTEQFREEASEAVRMLKAGNRGFARVMLRSMSTYCIACHSRFPTHDLSNWVSKASIESLKGMDRANFLSASRQFNQAIETYEGILKEKSGQNIQDYERAARSALALHVRVKGDPDGSLSLIEKILANPETPYFLKEQVRSWKEDLQSWKAETVKTFTTEAAYFNESKRLVSAARARQRFPADRSADVLYLRATSVLHRLLTEYPKSLITAEALLMLGNSYEVLGDIGIRDFNESYYLACIKMAPHTRLSRECYGKYEESVYLGYTGSGGTFIPADVRKKLHALDLLSVVEPAKVTVPPQLQ